MLGPAAWRTGKSTPPKNRRRKKQNKNSTIDRVPYRERYKENKSYGGTGTAVSGSQETLYSVIRPLPPSSSLRLVTCCALSFFISFIARFYFVTSWFLHPKGSPLILPCLPWIIFSFLLRVRGGNVKVGFFSLGFCFLYVWVDRDESRDLL